MKSLPWIAVACVAMIAIGCAPTVYNSGTSASSGNYQVTDFNGDWHLVTRGSDTGGNWLDDRSRFGGDDWGTTSGGTETGGVNRVRYGAWFLPDEFRIDGDRRTLRILDQGGSVIAELSLDDSGYRYGSSGGEDYDRGVRAHWVSDRRFEVQRIGRNGQRITQTFTLENRRRHLVVGTQVERDGGTRSYTRVYDRA